MRSKILHESNCRMRVHMMQRRMSSKEADILAYYMETQEFIVKTVVHEATANMIIHYRSGCREKVLKAITSFSYEDKRILESMPEITGRKLNKKYKEKLVVFLLGGAARAILLPQPLKRVWTLYRSVRYILKGIKSLLRFRMDVNVLDAISIGVSMLRGDYQTASSVMMLLGLGGLMEEWTYKKSVDDLARTMALNVDKVWMLSEDTEVLVPVSSVTKGDFIRVHAGSLIPLDGKIISGEAMINQASLTGESVPVPKSEGGFAYAGTIVEEGELLLCVQGVSGQGRYDKIVSMIEESEKLKSNTESVASKLADRLVPYTLGSSLLTYLLTRNITKALSLLMVDYSCALKLAMPIAVLSAMRQAGENRITVKGGKFLEAVSKADVIVFDKTGTLTHACPVLQKVFACKGREEREMLKIAACLEEHYPHSIANAVVEGAKKRNITHKEMHSEVQYIVAHGIASRIGEEKVIIGSRHFVFEDEKVFVEPEDREMLQSLEPQYSYLYLAIDGKLAAILAIFDPLREEAAEVIAGLKQLGIKKLVMMTGDNEKTAAAIAKQLGVDEYYAEVLPEDKAEFVRRQKEKGKTVIMIGDGINDSPALSAADCGIAISDGAPIAREVADIMIEAKDLYELLLLKKLSDNLMKRIRHNYRFVIGFNSALMAAGFFGLMSPASSALWHNLSTVGICMQSMLDLNLV